MPKLTLPCGDVREYPDEIYREKLALLNLINGKTPCESRSIRIGNNAVPLISSANVSPVQACINMYAMQSIRKDMGRTCVRIGALKIVDKVFLWRKSPLELSKASDFVFEKKKKFWAHAWVEDASGLVYDMFTDVIAAHYKLYDVPIPFKDFIEGKSREELSSKGLLYFGAPAKLQMEVAHMIEDKVGVIRDHFLTTFIEFDMRATVRDLGQRCRCEPCLRPRLVEIGQYLASAVFNPKHSPFDKEKIDSLVTPFMEELKEVGCLVRYLPTDTLNPKLSNACVVLGNPSPKHVEEVDAESEGSVEDDLSERSEESEEDDLSERSEGSVEEEIEEIIEKLLYEEGELAEKQEKEESESVETLVVKEMCEELKVKHCSMTVMNSLDGKTQKLEFSNLQNALDHVMKM